MTEPAAGEPLFTPEAASPSEDGLASEEAIKFASGENLEDDGKRQEHLRHQTFRNHVNKASICLFWLLVILLGIGIVAFSYHLLTPECWHFLNEKQLDKLQTLLGAALLSSALTQYINKRLT